tara:strand:- start:413 stop:847 length:435 start_codon:yes stop_codon:yes gene_type:complete
MAFNIYQWRRNQLITEGEVSENKAQKVYDTIEKFLDPKYTDNMGKSAVISAISRGLFLEENLNENKVKVNDIEFSVKDSYPIDVAMGSGDKFEDENDFIAWKADFIEKYGNIELERGIIGWKVPSDNEIGKQAQADFDKYARRK